MSELDSDWEDDEALAEELLRNPDAFEIPSELLAEPEDEEEKLGYAERVKRLPVGEQLKLALKGGREARVILYRGANRMVKRFVLQNPRISDDELVMIAKNRSEESEFLETIGKKREWVKNYQLRLALATNPKTPMPMAVRFVPTLLERDLRQLAKSKNVANMVSGAAKRILLSKS